MWVTAILALASAATKVTSSLIQRRNALKAQQAILKDQRQIMKIQEQINSLDKQIQSTTLGIAGAQEQRSEIYRNSALALGGAAVLSAFVYFKKG